jgi:cytidine deaminase
MIDATVIRDMSELARAASKNAYCVYSKFPVGAAVLTDDGKIFAGCNVENVSFGLTICAERNAIFQAVAQGYKAIRAVVVFTSTNKPAAPCGACRQVISEFGPEAEVYSFCETDASLHCNMRDLLPHMFTPEFL